MSPSIWQLLVVLIVVVLIFGTKRLKNVGRDVGEAIKGFKQGVSDGDSDKPQQRLSDEQEVGNGKADRQREDEPAPRDRDVR